MATFTLVLISTFLVFLELSVLPFFKIFGATPFLVMPFLVLLSIRYKGYFHLFLAFSFGMVFDFASTGFFGRFTLIFLFTVLVGRIFFFRESHYNKAQSYITLLTLSTLAVYLSELSVLFMTKYIGWQSFLYITLTGLGLTLIFGFFVYRYGMSYVDWLNNKHRESFKG